MESVNKDTLWHEVLESIKVSVSGPVFSTWISQTHLANLNKLDDKRYYAEIACASSFIKNTIEQRYFGLIQDLLSKNLGLSCDITFTVKPAPVQITQNLSSPLFEKKDLQEELEASLERSRLRSGFTFENFAVSSSNQMAFAAAEAVSQNPGKSYNPLFTWGGVGVGKSHLMLAIGYNLLKKDTQSKVYYCTSEEFTNDIIEGIRNKTTQAFREKYRKLKALLIDDIQFIAGKDAVQVEFFHTFNAVTSAGGQVVLTSDKPPSEISRLEERLKSRFEAGLIVDISPPDFELRCAIVQIKLKERGLDLSPELVQVIAGNLDAARKIEGFIIKLISEIQLKKVEVSEDLIKILIGRGDDKISVQKRSQNPGEVIEVVCKHFNVSKKAILGPARSRIIARPRQILMYLLRIELGLALEEVGRIVGRDHSTVIHAVDRITSLASINVQIREDMLGIKKALWG